MAQQFEYLICQSQQGRMTVANDTYLGQHFGDQADPENRRKMYASCPSFNEYVTTVGAEGWELVCAYNLTNENGQFEKLIFKRLK